MHFFKISLFLKFKRFLIVLKFSLRFNFLKFQNFDKVPVSQRKSNYELNINISFLLAILVFLEGLAGLMGQLKNLITLIMMFNVFSLFFFLLISAVSEKQR